MKKKTPAEQARITAGYSLAQAAYLLNLSPRYLRQIELHGRASLKTSRRLAHLYKCSGDTFLHPPAYIEQLGQRVIELSHA
jgi:transcriptional regulator with XRE-family HTH domain